MSKVALNRESILRGDMRKLAEQRPGYVRLMSDEDRDTIVEDVINTIPEKTPDSGDLWIFGYGSLIWNPAFHFVERTRARIHGYHRRFCMWTQLGRGTPEYPGLMLGLDRGGSCTGVCFRIAADQVRTELDIVFRRELLSYAYKPTWVMAKHADGEIPCITFVMDREHERYAGEVDLPTQVRHLSHACGPLGDNCSYLFDLVEHLQDLGFVDRSLFKLAKAVREHQSQCAHSPELPATSDKPV